MDFPGPGSVPCKQPCLLSAERTETRDVRSRSDAKPRGICLALGGDNRYREPEHVWFWMAAFLPLRTIATKLLCHQIWGAAGSLQSDCQSLLVQLLPFVSLTGSARQILTAPHSHLHPLSTPRNRGPVRSPRPLDAWTPPSPGLRGRKQMGTWPACPGVGGQSLCLSGALMADASFPPSSLNSPPKQITENKLGIRSDGPPT